MILDSSPLTECRDSFVDLLETEIVGPHHAEEVLSEKPHVKYVAGHLAPLPSVDENARQDSSSDADEREDLRGTDEVDVISPDDDTSDALEDSSISRARNESLCSVGLSFVVEPGARLNVKASWGEYSKEGLTYRRAQRSGHVDLHLPGPVHLSSYNVGRADIQWVARQTSSGHLICSCFLVNVTKNAVGDGTERLYQVALEVTGHDNRAFLSRDLVVKRSGPPSQDDLLYRDRKEFGVGLHVAVQQDDIDVDAGRCGRLRTQVVPRVETYVTKAREFENSRVLSMPYLARADQREIFAELNGAFAGYKQWLSDLGDTVAKLPSDLQAIAREHCTAIEARVARIDRGIELLERDARVLRAFRFANECMARMRFRQEHRQDGIGEDWDTALSGDWYPFQLAFLLSVIPDVIAPDARHRSLVDILFFPTGGGKTEAYLGIAAFVIAWRRIAGEAYDGAGVAILMRYTLRLLTTQQFSRAASMIAAAEMMRISNWGDGCLGPVPFGIGLWVGPMTPSTFDDAQQAIFQAQIEHKNCPRDCELSRTDKLTPPKKKSSSANISVLTECPWCLSPLCVENVAADKKEKRVRIRCGNTGCPFSSAQNSFLPVWFVDTDIYSQCPTMLIATVDKFATLPYKGAAKALFGKWSGYCSACGAITDLTVHGSKCEGRLVKSGPAGAPELIIQDELHTISDNIGSVYGVYETTIEYLCRGSKMPKYIAATATVKDVARQVAQLYGGRPSAVFPPTGLRAGDTYFSEDLPANKERFGRTYVGVYAPTKSRLTTFVSTLSAALAAGGKVREQFGAEAADPYLTILGYFNTIRDLGSVKALLADDVPPLIKRLCEENSWPERSVLHWEEELTGRIDASEVPQRLAALQTPFDAEGHGVDFMACTSMISVGVDVPRLGLMVVDGQTKTTAEYIQTTSRVGRRKPGIVIVVYNAMRPRDVSHYEHFYAYHQSYYRFVEAGSVTPFSSGCVDRYLAGAFVAGYRLSDSVSENGAADRFKRDEARCTDSLINAFEARAAVFGPEESETVQSSLDEIVTKWATYEQPLQYAKVKPPPGVPLKKTSADAKASVVRAPGDKSNAAQALFVAPTSMRNVESAVPLKVNTYGE